ncbi:unnamed protein product [Auanema sp. JU1783]|nr:unnamed protein product [Auanema sp. JU1783]
MSEEERKWREEREKVLDEWSEIELKFRSGTPIRIEITQGSVDDCMDDIISDQPISWDSGIPDDSLISRVLNDDYQLEKESLTGLKTADEFSMNKLMLRCICKPSSSASSLQTEQLKDERILLIAMSKKEYSSQNANHWQLLREFYRSTASLALDDPLLANECPHMGSHWQIVGFQGTNPSTDLRGVGLLGLVQLYCLTNLVQEDKLKEMIMLSRNEPNDFPFAVVGINFTSLLLNKLKRDELNSLANHFGSFLKAMNVLYRGCFIKFCKLWKKDNCTVKDFQHVLNAISAMLKKDANALVKA